MLSESENNILIIVILCVVISLLWYFFFADWSGCLNYPILNLDLNALANGDIVVYNPVTKKWENKPNTLKRLLDTDVNTPENGDVLTYNSAKKMWVSSPANGGATPSLGELTNVNVDADNPTKRGQLIMADHADQPGDPPEWILTNATDPANGYVLTWVGDATTGSWEPKASTLKDLTDTDVTLNTGPTDGDLLLYNSLTTKWENNPSTKLYTPVFQIYSTNATTTNFFTFTPGLPTPVAGTEYFFFSNQSYSAGPPEIMAGINLSSCNIYKNYTNSLNFMSFVNSGAGNTGHLIYDDTIFGSPTNISINLVVDFMIEYNGSPNIPITVSLFTWKNTVNNNTMHATTTLTSGQKVNMGFDGEGFTNDTNQYRFGLRFDNLNGADLSDFTIYFYRFSLSMKPDKLTSLYYSNVLNEVTITY